MCKKTSCIFVTSTSCLCLSVNLNKWSKREDNYKGVNGPSILNWYNTVQRSSFQTTHRRHSSLPQSGLLPVLNKEVDTGSTHLNSRHRILYFVTKYRILNKLKLLD